MVVAICIAIVHCCFSDYVCLNVEVVDACIDADYCFISFLLSVVKPGMADMRIIDSCCNGRPLLNVEVLYGQLVVM